MRISATIFVILISACIVNASVLDPVIENVVHLKASKPPSGIAGMWKKKTIWKPRWVKEWKSAKVMKPVWKKVWSPVQIREWVPIPKPPPGWDSISTRLTSLHSKPQKAPIKDSTGHNSFTVLAKTPLWDPIPYPESQQPPPLPPFSQPLHNADSYCDKGICDSSHSGTFNQQQISEIIGPKPSTPEYFHNSEFSETVNHLTRLPPDGNNWKPPLSDSQSDNRFSGFSGLPEFLVPPMFHLLPESNFRLQTNSNQQPFVNHLPIPREPASHSPALEAPNSFRQWIPFPPEMKIKGHFITKESDQPHKFQFPEMERHIRNRTEKAHGETFSNNESKEKGYPHADNLKTGFRLQADGDTVQEAHLVGEYHYSEFDLPKLEQEPKKPQQNIEEKEQVQIKVQEKVKASGPDVQKHKTNRHPLGEEKQSPNRTRIELETQHVQKKHISNFPSSTPNANFFYQPQKAVLKEILPSHNPPPLINDKLISENRRFALPLSGGNHKQQLPINFSSTILLAVEPEINVNSSGTNVSSLYQKENYPVYKPSQSQIITPPGQKHSQISNSASNFSTLSTNTSIQQQKQHPVYETSQKPTVLSHNHRFSPPPKTSGTNVSTSHREEYYPVYEIPEISTVIPPNHRVLLPLDNSPEKPKGRNHHNGKSPAIAPTKAAKAEKTSFEKKGSVQLVFPAADEEVSALMGNKLSSEALQKMTTTEPYSVIFSSSLLSKTEAVTKSPVMIVTPIIQKKS